MSWQTIALFAAMEFVFSITPGPAVLLVSAYGFKAGVRASFAASLGIQTGNTIYLLLSAAGLGAILATSETAFTIVKYAGAAYLVFLGLRTIWKAGAPRESVRVRTIDHPYVQAVLTQLGNPKAVLVFGALLPQFLDTHRPIWPQYLIMWAIIAAGETLILGGYGWLAARGSRFVSTRLAVWRERLSGAVLILVGALFATVRRGT